MHTIKASSGNNEQLKQRPNRFGLFPLDTDMQLDQADIEEFKMLYETEFDEQITMANAERMARDVMSLFEALYECGLQRQKSTRAVPEAQARTLQQDV